MRKDRLPTTLGRISTTMRTTDECAALKTTVDVTPKEPPYPKTQDKKIEGISAPEISSGLPNILGSINPKSANGNYLFSIGKNPYAPQNMEELSEEAELNLGMNHVVPMKRKRKTRPTTTNAKGGNAGEAVKIEVPADPSLSEPDSVTARMLALIEASAAIHEANASAESGHSSSETLSAVKSESEMQVPDFRQLATFLGSVHQADIPKNRPGRKRKWFATTTPHPESSSISNIGEPSCSIQDQESTSTPKGRMTTFFIMKYWHDNDAKLPEPLEAEILAKASNLSPKQVLNWFYSRRRSRHFCSKQLNIEKEMLAKDDPEHVFFEFRNNGSVWQMFSEEAIELLRQYFYTHLDDPFPSREEMEVLIMACGMNKEQINNWFKGQREACKKHQFGKPSKRIKEEMVKYGIETLEGVSFGLLHLQRYDTDMVQFMERFYAANINHPFLTAAKSVELAEASGMAADKIRAWFGNKRRICKSSEKTQSLIQAIADTMKNKHEYDFNEPLNPNYDYVNEVYMDGDGDSPETEEQEDVKVENEEECVKQEPVEVDVQALKQEADIELFIRQQAKLAEFIEQHKAQLEQVPKQEQC